MRIASILIFATIVLTACPGFAKARQHASHTGHAATQAAAQPAFKSSEPVAPPQVHPRSTTLPLPRFSTLKADKVYVRTGPGMEYPFEWVYRREGLPVEIIQEYDQWRQVRDSEGGVGWVNELLISTRRNVLVKGEDTANLRADGVTGGRVIAQAEPGVIAALKRCNPQFCEISAGGYRGWIDRGRLWGVYGNEILN